MENNVPMFLKRTLEEDCHFCHSSAWQSAETEASFAFVNYDYPVTHTHNNYCEICVVLSGEVMNHVNGRSYLMRAGDCCLLHRDDHHMLRFADAEQENYLSINFVIRYSYYERLKYAFGEAYAHLFDRSEEPKSFRIEAPESDKLYRETLQIQAINNDYLAENELICKNLILQLMQKYVEQRICTSRKKAIPEWLQTLLIDIQKPENAGKRTGDFSKDVGYSSSYIAKEFRHYMGCSMVRYVNMVKLQRAKELLLHTELTILEISTRLGFSSLSHFYHIFKDFFGYSPSSLRKE